MFYLMILLILRNGQAIPLLLPIPPVHRSTNTPLSHNLHAQLIQLFEPTSDHSHSALILPIIPPDLLNEILKALDPILVARLARIAPAWRRMGVDIQGAFERLDGVGGGVMGLLELLGGKGEEVAFAAQLDDQVVQFVAEDLEGLLQLTQGGLCR